MGIRNRLGSLITFGRLSERNAPVGFGDSQGAAKPREPDAGPHRTQRSHKTLGIRLATRLERVLGNPLFRRGLGAAFLFIGLAMAFSAHELSQELGVERWFGAHPPSRRFTHAVFGSFGFSPARFGNDVAGKSARRTLKKLPENSDTHFRIWISDDVNWSAVAWPATEVNQANEAKESNAGEAGTAIEIWCRNCGTSADRFLDQGTSWSGLDAWSKIAARSKKSPIGAPNTASAAIPAWRHPKDVRVWR